MKIAILTQPLRANYGGILQNFALQQVLKDLGHTSITLEKDYRQYISHTRLFIELPKRLLTKYILRKREHIFSEYKDNQDGDNIRKILKPFVVKYINHEYIKRFDSIKISDYKTFIVGSDQVWRPIYNLGCIDKLFLSFIPKSSNLNRIAYAASFGTNEWEYDVVQTKQCAELIQYFNAVSTRELDGVNLCAKYLNRNDVISVLDPTLLLNKNVYLNLCKKIKKQNKDILLAYILDQDDTIIEHLKFLAKKTELELTLISADEDCSLSMEEWLTMFRDAKYIITDSFHGTVFSIIFNKEFYTIANQSRGGSRFTSLLSQLSLADRICDSILNIEIKEHIDWTMVNNKLKVLKEKSLNFLKTNLS